MDFDPSSDYGDDVIILSQFGECAGFNIRAWMCADAQERAFIGDERIGHVPASKAPLPFDIVFSDDSEVSQEELERVRCELDKKFARQFDERVRDVIDQIKTDGWGAIEQ